MITVIIAINGRPIYTRTAHRLDDNDPNTESSYKVDEGSIIKHKRNEGAIKLVHKMLNTINDEE